MAFVTLPDESTVTRTVTLTVPWMVFLAVVETSGKTCWSTSSCATAPAGAASAAVVAEDLALEFLAVPPSGLGVLLSMGVPGSGLGFVSLCSAAAGPFGGVSPR